MNVDVYSYASGTWTNASTINGNFGNAWLSDTVDLSSYVGDTVQIRFVVNNSSNSFTHDIAIDDFSVIDAVFTGTGTAVMSNTCSNDSSGVAAVSYVFNNGNVSISWSNGASGDTITGLADGTYTATLTDAGGATSIVPVTIGSQFNAPTFTSSSMDVLCNGGSTGMVAVDSILTANPFVPDCGDTNNISMDMSIVNVDTLGTGTATNSTTGYPAIFGNWYWGARHQILYRASELQAQGMQAGYITAIEVPVTQINGTSNYSGFRIAMTCTSESTMGSGWLTGLLEVRSPASHTVTVGWNTLTFDVPYYWDGTSNIVLETCFNNSGFTNNSATPYTNTGYTSVRYYRADNANVCSSTTTTSTSANRPNITFVTSPFVPVLNVSYQWSSSANDTMASVSGLSAGTYTVTVQDAFCENSASLTVSEPAPLMATSMTTDALCFGDSTGTATLNITGGVGGLGGASLLITETNPNSPDFVEIMNVSGQSVNVTGWKVVVSSSYTIINSANATTWNLTGSMAPGAVMYREDVTGANYWGNNIFWASGNNSWAMIIDNNNNIVDVVFWGWGSTDIAGFAPVVSGQTISIGNAWTGNGIPASCSNSFIRTGTSDNNDVSDWSCGTVSKGSANAGLVTPFAGGYAVSWSNSAMGSSVSNFPAGSYTYTVTDNNNCTTNGSVTIGEPTALTSSINTSSFVGGWEISCFFGSDGTAAVSNSGGTPGYTHSWTGPGGFSSMMDSIGGLDAGAYYVTTTDNNGCTLTDTVTLNAPPQGVGGSAVANDVNCNGDTDGSATVTAAGGTPGYSYMWPGGMNTSNTATMLAAGNYFVSVTDTNGCTGSITVTINEPTAIMTSIDSLVDASCNGSMDGYAQASATGGDPGYTYAWSSGSNTNAANNLAAGSYVLTVTDMSGCESTDTVTIAQPDPIGVTTANSSDANCEGSTDGQVTISSMGGNGPYTYSWEDGSTDSTLMNVATGSYMVTVTDANGCTGTGSATIGFLNPAPVVNLGADTSICEGSSIMLDAGNPGSTFAWSGGENTQSITVDATGAYSVMVTDGNGCSSTDTISVDVRICTGVNEWGQTITVRYFPNPTNGLLNIQVEDNTARDVEIQVLDYSGRLILNRKLHVSGGTFTEQIDLSNQSQGLYFVNLLLDGERFTQRVTVY